MGARTRRERARRRADWGADVILGTHPHVVQDAEWKTSVDGRQTFVAYSLGNFLSTQSKPDQLIGAILTLELNKTTDPDGSVHCAVASPQLHPTVTHYDAGKSNVRTNLFRDYPSELAQAHGVRAAYPSFGIDYKPTSKASFGRSPEFAALWGRLECSLCMVFPKSTLSPA